MIIQTVYIDGSVMALRQRDSIYINGPQENNVSFALQYVIYHKQTTLHFAVHRNKLDTINFM